MRLFQVDSGDSSAVNASTSASTASSVLLRISVFSTMENRRLVGAVIKSADLANSKYVQLYKIEAVTSVTTMGVGTEENEKDDVRYRTQTLVTPPGPYTMRRNFPLGHAFIPIGERNPGSRAEFERSGQRSAGAKTLIGRRARLATLRDDREAIGHI